MTTRRRQRGVALLMALLVVALVGGVLAVCARRSAQAALAAGEDLQQLQVRWAMISARQVLLPRCPELLDQVKVEHQPWPRLRAVKLAMGRLDLELVVADEQAKANLNLLARQMDDPSLLQVLQEFQGMCHQPLGIELSAPAAGSRIPPEDRFASYEQFIRFDHPRQLLADLETSLVGQVSCWGDGRLNWHKSTELAMKTVLSRHLSAAQIRKLLDLRQRDGLGAKMAIRELTLPKEKAQAVAELLTDGSDCHSLWVVAQDPQRQWHRLLVTQGSRGGREWTFAW